MSKSNPVQTYCDLAFKLRNRIEFAETILTVNAPSSQIVETVCLQGRKIIETIAFMSLVATEHGLGSLRVPRDVKTHWNAKTIFERLKKKNIDILPSPSRMQKTDDKRFDYIFAGVPENRLSYDDLIHMYETFHRGLHEPNPYVQSDESAFYKKLLDGLNTDIAKLRRFTWIHFIGIKGQAFMVDLKNTLGNTYVLPVTKSGEVPEDYVAVPPSLKQ
jgi:hypothetical protein